MPIILIKPEVYTATIRGPKEIAAGVPFTIRYTYTGREPAPAGTTRQRAVSMAMTEHYDPQHPNNSIKTYTYCDGLGRIVQTRKEAAVNGVEKLVISGHTVVDALGRTVETYYPTEIHKDSTRFRFIIDQSAPASTVTYDILDRPLVQTAPDASTTTFQYGFDNSHQNKMLFSSTTTDANSHPSIELKDVSGKPWVIHPSGQQPVCFNYNLVGDNTRVYSSVANDWERNYTYDRLGRRLSSTEGELAESFTYNGGNLSAHTQSWLENGIIQNKTTHYHYNAHRLDSVSYDDALTTIYHYNAAGQPDSVYDESGVMCYEYGDMGEVTQETRIYALPFLTNPLALSTQFTYDSWGRIQEITYPDNEVVGYTYDLGGQLQSITNNSSYTYLDNVTYDRFGAKMSQTYGNGIATDYSYHNLTRRLTDIIISDGTAISYTYDPVGNVTQVASSYSWMQGQNLTETFTYDASDQLVSASETQAQSYLLDVTYGNWGKISDYDLTRTDFFNGAITQESRSFAYPSDPSGVQEAQTMFAPESQTGTTDAQFTFGINGSLRRMETHSPEHNLEHYLFNSAANLKAYSSEAMDFAYYGYNASNARTYKLSLSGTYQWHNGQQLQLSLQPQLSMFYPNAYINFNGNGEYTKHYYSGSERIASRLGNANTDITVTANARLTSRSTQLDSRFQDDIRELMSDNSTVCPPSGISVNSLHQTGTSDIYYYHTNHLGSTAFVTDQNQNITQGFLYAPFGEITTEYNSTFGNDIIPKYSFNAKELDEETGMYYYEARYYKPPVFTSRDAMFEKKPWFSPYVYCKNNPVLFIDPDGRDEWKVDEMGYVSKTGNKGGIKQQTVIFSNGNTKTFNGKNYHVILSDLTKVEKRDGNNLSKSLGDENMQSAMLNVFKSMADNTNVEWRLDRFNNGNKRDCYAIGTFHDKDKSPGARYMGYSQQSVVTFIHSHPEVDIKEELSSMGWTPPYIFKPSDYYNNTYAPEYSKTTSYVYFPMSNNLWHVRKGKIPSFIKTIKKSSDFFFGTLNTR